MTDKVLYAREIILADDRAYAITSDDTVFWLCGAIAYPVRYKAIDKKEEQPVEEKADE